MICSVLSVNAALNSSRIKKPSEKSSEPGPRKPGSAPGTSCTPFAKLSASITSKTSPDENSAPHRHGTLSGDHRRGCGGDRSRDRYPGHWNQAHHLVSQAAVCPRGKLDVRPDESWKSHDRLRDRH